MRRLFDKYDATLIIYLPREPGDVLSLDLDTLPEGSDFMSTYEELQIILTTALLIVAILTYTYKK